MTADQLADIVRLLPPGVSVSFSLTLDGAASAAARATKAADPTPTRTPAPGDEPLKLDACSQAFDVPVRELKRAIKGGFLHYTLKKKGRDAGARLIRPEDARRYVELRRRIAEGEVEPPEDWSGPRGIHV